MTAVALGILQGLTEFLPVSSSGHLVIAETLLGVKPPGVTFEVALHVGTLLAVLLYFGRDVWLILRSVGLALAGRGPRGGDRWSAWREDPNCRLAWLVVVASLPAAVAGLALKPLFEALFFSPFTVAVMLLLTGALLWLADVRRGGPVRAAASLGAAEAFAVGVLQAAAIAPGLSRSGATIAGGVLLGVERADAARFSFLLSLPAVAGAAAVSFVSAGAAGAAGADVGMTAFVLGAAAAAVSGYVAIAALLQVLRRGRLIGFSFYCWAVGLLLLVAHGLGLA